MRVEQEIGILIDTPKQYDKLLSIVLGKREQVVRASAIKFGNIQSNSEILDVGCGTGTLAIQIKKEYGNEVNVYGIDPSPQMIPYAIEKAKKEQCTISFEVQAIQSLKFPDNTFDVVFLSLVLHHIPEHHRIAGINEIMRVLKPGGRLIIVEFNAPSKRIWRFLGFFVVGHMIFNRIETFIEELKKAGIQNCEIGQTPVDIFVNLKCTKPK